MSYPTQSGTLARLESETRKAGRELEDKAKDALQRAWDGHKAAMRSSILQAYSRHSRAGNWTLATAAPALSVINISVHAILEAFYANAKKIIGQAELDAYRHESLRQVWMLDQLTPQSHKPLLPRKAILEANRPGEGATWDQAISEWLTAYSANLRTNLRLEALHEGSLTDAADEVDAAKIDGFDPSYKFASLLTNKVLASQQEARSDVAAENEDMVAEEVFQTMEDARVCDICDDSDGKLIDDAEPIPAHFKCRCFARIVPRAFAEMLRNGTPEEKEAALMMDARGLIPDVMAIKDAAGNLKAHIIVSFDQWMGGDREQEIMGRAGAQQVR